MTITLNGEPLALAESLTVDDLLADRPRSGIAVALNGTVVPRAVHATTSLNDGDRLEIVTAVQGG
jgi:sulfur carrier protein